MKDSGEIVVGANGSINLGPLGTEVPVDPDVALGDEFLELGYATPDGLTPSYTPNITGIPAWQSPRDVRKINNGRVDRVAFQLLQWNDPNWKLAFGGGEFEEVEDGIFQYNPPAATDPLPEHCLVTEWQDGERKFRHCIYRGSHIEGVSTNVMRTGASVLPVVFEVVENDDGHDWNMWSNDPAFDPAVS